VILAVVFDVVADVEEVVDDGSVAYVKEPGNGDEAEVMSIEVVEESKGLRVEFDVELLFMFPGLDCWSGLTLAQLLLREIMLELEGFKGSK
jgi:hypothetical protein